MKKYYFSVLIQDTELIEEIDNIRQNSDNVCEYVCDLLCGVGFEENADNFTEYEPYIGKGSDFCVDTCQEYTLLCNNTLCGDYMLYREATEGENEWLADYYGE